MHCPHSAVHVAHSAAIIMHLWAVRVPHVLMVHIASLAHDGESCAADDYNWCAVPHRPWDTLLFAGIAVVIACLSQGPYSSLIVLVAGEIWMKEKSDWHQNHVTAWPSQQHCATRPLVARCTPSLRA